jgi:hypothetical protein
MCGLDRDQVDAIAEHEHIPEIAAAALGHYLLHQSGGIDKIRTMIIEDIRTAAREGRTRHAAELVMALRHLLEQHPQKAG